MSNNFQALKANNSRQADLLSSMHKLRYEVFYKEMGWTRGLDLVRKMEFDEYDRDQTDYIVRVDDQGEVDACCRLLPTNQNYMLKDHYPQFIEDIPIPETPLIWEISRFCASTDARSKSNGTVSGQLIAASIEFGLRNNISNYIALATQSIIPIIRRNAGWDPQPVGRKQKTDDDVSCSVMYTVSQEMLERVRQKNQITGVLLSNIPSVNSAVSMSQAA